jgi:hypothetical protein
MTCGKWFLPFFLGRISDVMDSGDIAFDWISCLEETMQHCQNQKKQKITRTKKSHLEGGFERS